MSDETTETEQEPQDRPEEEADEPSRIAGGLVLLVLSGVAVLVLKAIVTAAPYVAYFVAGVIVCVGWQRVRAWIAKRRGPESEAEFKDEEQLDVTEALRHLGRHGDSVLLTQLRERLRVADTKTVRVLLKEEGIRVRSGVRTPAGNGPGVHHDDIPPLPSSAGEEHGEGCCCRSANNANANNDPEEAPGEGLRVEPIGLSGAVIRDPADAYRHHHVQ